jgi:hypothetical protein
MPTSANTVQKSLQWMINLGVDQGEVEWLGEMQGSMDLHLPIHRQRVEQIYSAAIGRWMESPDPEKLAATIALI